MFASTAKRPHMVNTIMVERVLHEDNMRHRMQSEDFNALTPLVTLNINPRRHRVKQHRFFYEYKTVA